MSKETMLHLNRNTLIGYTEKRGTAWHYREDLQSEQPNHYPGPIPAEDVRTRLFHWKPVEADVTATALTSDGVLTITDPTRKAIVRPDTQQILGIFRSGYKVHDYDEWLLRNVERIIDTGELQIGSAGLLRGGALAWVQVELEDTLEVGGVEFRPFLTAATSLDGSLATTYQTGCQVVVCDNTLSAALGENSAKRLKIIHSRASLGRMLEVRDALGIVHTLADDFSQQIETLTAQPVSELRFTKWAEAYAGLDEEKTSKRGQTMAEGKRDQLIQLWNHDERVNPWRGTAYGVLAAANTYAHHYSIVRGASRAERNAERLVIGEVAKVDQHALKVLAATV